jgi:hypothetical protein
MSPRLHDTGRAQNLRLWVVHAFFPSWECCWGLSHSAAKSAGSPDGVVQCTHDALFSIGGLPSFALTLRTGFFRLSTCSQVAVTGAPHSRLAAISTYQGELFSAACVVRSQLRCEGRGGKGEGRGRKGEGGWRGGRAGSAAWKGLIPHAKRLRSICNASA